MLKPLSYLALGDSYTIGEGVTEKENFPSQTVSILKQIGIEVEELLIVAKTGWTTDELMGGILKSAITKRYDFVSLLIGVNNQYRGRPTDNYSKEFEDLLNKAIHFAGENPASVYILSIPDWGVTPFAEGRDREKIAAEIDDFNESNQLISTKYKVNYVDITASTRKAVGDISLLTEDKLHPSGKEYRKWAEELAKRIQANLKL